MSTYKIQHQIKTLAKLHFGTDGPKETVIEIDGYSIKNWGYSVEKGPYGDAWIIEKLIEADSGIKAINLFREGFYHKTAKLCFISQCYLDFLNEPFLIEKMNDNPDKEFLLRLSIEQKPCGLYFTKKQYDSFTKLDKIKELEGSDFFIYMQESCNSALGYYSKLSSILSALEALAGKKQCTNSEGKEYSTYDMNVMKAIIGNSNYNTYFGEKGIRHKIHHGEITPELHEKNHVAILYACILEYFNSTYDIGLTLDIKNPQRHFYGNEQFIYKMLSPIDKIKEQDLDLKIFIQNNKPLEDIPDYISTGESEKIQNY